jgi:hypothetical protein
VLDSGESIPTAYQKIPNYMVFDVKFDIKNKACLVEVYNWIVNQKEDIY